MKKSDFLYFNQYIVGIAGSVTMPRTTYLNYLSSLDGRSRRISMKVGKLSWTFAVRNNSYNLDKEISVGVNRHLISIHSGYEKINKK